MSERNGLFVDYCAKDFLDGTQLLDPWEELAYRRIVDMIYATNDKLPDDDRKLAWMTKVGARWKAIKESLIASGKIVIQDGRVSNIRCQTTLEKSARKILQAQAAGKASAATGKSLKNINGPRTDVVTGVVTDARTTQRPKDLSKKEESPPASRVPPKGGDDRGSRLPNDFVVPEEWIIEGDELRASRQLPPADTRTEALGFALYWSTVPGPKGRKTNWHRTWLNRCLAMKGINHGRPGKPKHDWHDVAAGVVLDIHGGDRHRDSAEDRGFAGPFLDAGCFPGEPCGDDPGLDRGSAGILSLDNYRRLP